MGGMTDVPGRERIPKIAGAGGGLEAGEVDSSESYFPELFSRIYFSDLLFLDLFLQNQEALLSLPLLVGILASCGCEKTVVVGGRLGLLVQ
jgi:hypothetical protein